MTLRVALVVGAALALAASGCAQAPSVAPVADSAAVEADPEPEAPAPPLQAADTVQFSIDGVLHTCEEQGVGDYDCWEGSSTGIGVPDSYCSDGYDWCSEVDYPWADEEAIATSSGGDSSSDYSGRSFESESDGGYDPPSSPDYSWDDNPSSDADTWRDADPEETQSGYYYGRDGSTSCYETYGGTQCSGSGGESTSCYDTYSGTNCSHSDGSTTSCYDTYGGTQCSGSGGESTSCYDTYSGTNCSHSDGSTTSCYDTYGGTNCSDSGGGTTSCYDTYSGSNCSSSGYDDYGNDDPYGSSYGSDGYDGGYGYGDG